LPSFRPLAALAFAVFSAHKIVPMPIALAVLILLGLIPIALALRANRGTSLLHALVWTLIAWLAWGAAFLCDDLESTEIQPVRYCALCLTGCAGVAVLGARRPHVFAWNFVVLSLFAVMAWPLLETRILGTHTFDGLRIVFVVGTIAIGIMNYLPTRLAPAAALLLLACGGEMVLLFSPEQRARIAEPRGFDWMLILVPWLAWVCLRRRNEGLSDVDRLWLSFRDHWGLVWGQRVREQFNHAAHHAGWPVRLAWRGLRQEKETPALGPEEEQKIAETLKSVLQRFIAADQDGGSGNQRPP
jgi:hypothetical protein